MPKQYLTTSIPYVNGRPHLGHALELVHVDTLARHHRSRGRHVRTQSGTDDHAIKNVTAASEGGVSTAELVAANGDRFADLTHALGAVPDEFVRTSTDPRHRAAVSALWDACLKNGDLYTKDYTGLYCAGCEQFYAPEDLTDGHCAEHTAPAHEVTETNWFFRLSAYRDTITNLITTGELAIEPAQRRNEVLGFLAGEVHDLSVSRPAARTGGWGVPVPADPDQVVYVWFDALTNYLTGLGYPDQRGDYATWWAHASERTHIIGKGIVRFHAVYWIAFLLSAHLPLPTRLLVHDYLTVDGAKISKSGDSGADPGELAATYGTDATRWWLLAEPALVGTTDFTTERLIAAYNRDLANTIGNLTSRVLTLNGRERTWSTPPAPGIGDDLAELCAALPGEVDAALQAYDLRRACEAIVNLADAGNKLLETHTPWHLAKAAAAGDTSAGAQFDAVIGAVLHACRTVALELTAFAPTGAGALLRQLDEPAGTKPVAAFPRIVT